MLQLPRKEQEVAPELLSSITMTIGHTPVLSPSGPEQGLAGALESLQANFSLWDRAAGKDAAQAIVEHATHLLSGAVTWSDEPFVRIIASVAKAASDFARDANRLASATQARDFRASVRYLSDVIKPCLANRHADPHDVARIAEAVHRLAATHALSVSRTR